MNTQNDLDKVAGQHIVTDEFDPMKLELNKTGGYLPATEKITDYTRFTTVELLKMKNGLELMLDSTIDNKLKDAVSHNDNLASIEAILLKRKAITVN